MNQPNALISRNIRIGGRRTSVRLETSMWEALKEICQRQGVTVHVFCEGVDRQRGDLTLTAAIRVAIVAYYRRHAVQVEPDRRGMGKSAAKVGAPGLASGAAAASGDRRAVG